MKKWNNKGFMLAETLVISVVVLTTLVVVYVQFRNVEKSYENSFLYNNVNDLYRVNNMRDFLMRDSTILTQLKTSIDSGVEYIDLSTCPTFVFPDNEYCIGLWKVLGVKTAIFTKQDLVALRTVVNTANPFSEGLKQFLKSFSPNNEDRYRLLVEFEEGTFATLKVDR